MLARVSRNFAVQILALVLMIVERVVAVGLLVQAWGPNGYADWAILLSITGLLQLGELGLNVYNGNVWQRNHAAGDHAGSDRMLATALGNALVQGIVLLALALVFLALVDLPSALNLSTEEGASDVFVMLSLFTILMVMRGSISQLYRGHGLYVRGSIVALLGTAALLGSTALAISVDAGPVALAAAYLACQIVFGIVLAVWDLRRSLPHLHWRVARPSWRAFLPIWKDARWLAVEQCAPVAWLQLPVLAIGIVGLGGPALVAFLLIRTLAGFAKQVATMLSIAVGIEIAGGATSSAEDTSRLGALGRFLAATSAAASVGLILFGEAILSIWTGGTVPFDLLVAVWLGCGIVVSAIAQPIAKYLAFTNRARPNALAWIVQLAIGLSAMALTMPTYGIVGAAAALALGEGVGMGLVLPVLARRELRAPLAPYYRACVLGGIGSAGWCGFVGLLLPPASPSLEATLWILFAAVPVVIVASPSTLRRHGKLRWQQIFQQRQQA